MNLIDAKCPNCGSVIKLNREEKTGTCEHCNSKFLIDEAIQNFVTNNYIEHATIVKNDFGNDVLFNNIDIYIAQLNLSNFEEAENVISTLKEKFPHKGIARVAVLHYEFLLLINKYGTEEDFFNEAENIEKVNKSYFPKSYKKVPPLSKYADDDIVETAYANGLNELLTDEEKQKYSNLIDKTFKYIETYKQILISNNEMIEKFEPFEKKYYKHLSKIESKAVAKTKPKTKNTKTKIFVPLISFLIVLLICFIVVKSFYGTKTYVSANDINSLDSPTKISYSDSKNIEFSNFVVTCNFYYSYTVSGRVIGKKSFLPTSSKNKAIPIYIGLTWGELSTSEKYKTISWSYSSSGVSYSYSTSIVSKSTLEKCCASYGLVPSDKEIEKKLRCIGKYDAIKIEGYITTVKISGNGSSVEYGTKTTENSGIYLLYVTNIDWYSE